MFFELVVNPSKWYQWMRSNWEYDRMKNVHFNFMVFPIYQEKIYGHDQSMERLDEYWMLKFGCLFWRENNISMTMIDLRDCIWWLLSVEFCIVVWENITHKIKGDLCQFRMIFHSSFFRISRGKSMDIHFYVEKILRTWSV